MSNMPARNRRTARNASSERKGAQSAANLSMQLASAAIWPPSTHGNSPSRRIGNRPRGRPGDARCSRTRRRRGPREIHCPQGRGAATAAATAPRPRRRKRSGRMSLATRASSLRSRRVLPPLTAPGRRWSRKWHKPRTSSQEMHKIGNWQAWPIPKGGEHMHPRQNKLPVAGGRGFPYGLPVIKSTVGGHAGQKCSWGDCTNTLTGRYGASSSYRRFATG